MTEKKYKEKSDNVVDEHIRDRYELKKRLGKGAYGIVWKATDRTNQQTVAVKKIFDAFRNQTDAQRTFREIMFLMAFRDHPNVIRLRGLHKATNNKDIYLIFDFMETDLHHVIKKKTVLAAIHHRYIMYQLLRATAFLHSGNVIHRDQKPSNILINSECRIKIADFGLARSLSHDLGEDEDNPPLLTDYVATRWYRAPEILVAAKRYTKGVDMWSLGCILGEMIRGEPLFPGSCTVNQIERIMTVLPPPSALEVENVCSGYGKSLLEVKITHRSSLKSLMGNPDENVLNLVSNLLIFDPNKRMTAAEALCHSFVKEFVTGYEATLNKDVVPLLSDDIQLSVSEYRNKLYEMIDSARSAQKHQINGKCHMERKFPKKIEYSKNERAIITSKILEPRPNPIEPQIINGEIITKAKNGKKNTMSVEELIRRVQKKQPEELNRRKDYGRKNSQKYLCPVMACKSTPESMLTEPSLLPTNGKTKIIKQSVGTEISLSVDQIRRQKISGINLNKLGCVLAHMEQTLTQVGGNGEMLPRRTLHTPSDITYVNSLSLLKRRRMPEIKAGFKH